MVPAKVPFSLNFLFSLRLDTPYQTILHLAFTVVAFFFVHYFLLTYLARGWTRITFLHTQIRDKVFVILFFFFFCYYSFIHCAQNLTSKYGTEAKKGDIYDQEKNEAWGNHSDGVCCLEQIRCFSLHS
jgi:ABC-type branched-subunit amino acid transport system permease subunit